MIQFSILKSSRAWFYKFELALDSTFYLIRERPSKAYKDNKVQGRLDGGN